LRRSLLGYRRADVHKALAARDGALAELGGELEQASERLAMQGAELDAAGIELAGRGRRIEDLEQVATALSQRVVEREQELRALRAELARTRSSGEANLAALASLARELEDVRRQARGQATRIRLRALRDAAEIADRVGELSRRPAEMRERLLEALTEAVGRLGVEEGIDEPVVGVVENGTGGNGHGEIDAADLFEGLIEVEIGPLSDFAQLVLFEDAAKSIGATSEISVKRFSEGRATLAVSLREPVELLRELEERCDLDFRVRDVRGDRLVLDVGDEVAET
jgi:multidrug efflux pump subunit AcrA (membrane-fusion protein)